MAAFGSRSRKDRAPKQTLRVKVTVGSPSSSPQLLKADRLLKEATTKKKAGDLNGAVKTLRDAYKILNDNSMRYSIDMYLRLPLYLQEAGREDEAWSEFNKLVSWVNTKPRYSAEVTPMELSSIWDKMRLFLQREGKNEHAVAFGVWSYLSWAQGLHRQKRQSDLHSHTLPDNMQKTLLPLLSKARSGQLIDSIRAVVTNALEGLPNIDYKRVGERIHEILNQA